jgi:tetratricopeptide (TPR) repeat protein
MNLQTALVQYIQDPYNDTRNFNLGLIYLDMGQTASALSFFMRTAEWSLDNDLVYESLIMVGYCLSKQNRRFNSEMGVYLHAIRHNPTRPEAYYFLSLLNERKGEWLECMTNAKLADLFNMNRKQTRFDIGYRYYSPTFQMAVSSWWIGQIGLSKELFRKLSHDYGADLEPSYIEAVIRNINFLAVYDHPNSIYTSDMVNRLRYKFSGHLKVERNYSQVMQDMFVLTMLDGKREGTFVEIGSGDPFIGNNTFLLEDKFNWSGVSIDYSKAYTDAFKSRKKSKHLVKDATKINYDELFRELNLPKDIDYLQLDCDPNSTTYEVLKMIPFADYRFAVITYEHDDYTEGGRKFSERSRKYLKKMGYVLVVDNISPDRVCSFEDWWVHPELVNEDIIKEFKFLSNRAKFPKDFMLL